MSRPPLSLLSAVSSLRGKVAFSTLLIIRTLRVALTMKIAHTACAIALLIIRTLRVALTMKVAHTACAIALPISMQATAVGAQIESSISCGPAR